MQGNTILSGALFPRWKQAIYSYRSASTGSTPEALYAG